MKKNYFIVSILLIFLLASPAFAKFKCQSSIFYTWEKNGNVKTTGKTKTIDGKSFIEEYCGVISATEEDEAKAKNKLKINLLKKQGENISKCKKDHENLSLCIASKYKELGNTISSSSFSARKQIEESIKEDCENKQGICKEVIMKEAVCEEIKEEVKSEEEGTEENVDGKNKGNDKQAGKKEDKKNAKNTAKDKKAKK